MESSEEVLSECFTFIIREEKSRNFSNIMEDKKIKSLYYQKNDTILKIKKQDYYDLEENEELEFVADEGKLEESDNDFIKISCFPVSIKIPKNEWDIFTEVSKFDDEYSTEDGLKLSYHEDEDEDEDINILTVEYESDDFYFKANIVLELFKNQEECFDVNNLNF